MSGTQTKLEVVVLPVSDVERAKRFYGSLGGERIMLTKPGEPGRNRPCLA